MCFSAQRLGSLNKRFAFLKGLLLEEFIVEHGAAVILGLKKWTPKCR